MVGYTSGTSAFFEQANSLLSCIPIKVISQSWQDVPTGKLIPYAKATSVWDEKTAQKDVLIACDISNLELKWKEDKQRGSNQHTSKVQATNANPPHKLEVDLRFIW